ncbi:hypothetical protein B0H11DRAFT_2199416 [Mycena galericulata]|nr:hypothetical protein B0H11DRAFT_2199416 [Mycena galericulata]
MPKISKGKKARLNNLSKATEALTLKRSQTNTPIPEGTPEGTPAELDSPTQTFSELEPTSLDDTPGSWDSLLDDELKRLEEREREKVTQDILGKLLSAGSVTGRRDLGPQHDFQDTRSAVLPSKSLTINAVGKNKREILHAGCKNWRRGQSLPKLECVENPTVAADFWGLCLGDKQLEMFQMAGAQQSELFQRGHLDVPEEAQRRNGKSQQAGQTDARTDTLDLIELIWEPQVLQRVGVGKYFFKEMLVEGEVGFSGQEECPPGSGSGETVQSERDDDGQGG